MTATLVDGFNNAIAGSPVLFKVTGANSATGSDTTSGTGSATFTYTGTNAGTDTITACDDKDASGVCDPGELTKTVTKEWIGGQPCPPGVSKVNVRWHYSVNGSTGPGWSATKSTGCGNGNVTIGPQAMGGDLKVAPGSSIALGYSFTLPGNQQSWNATVSATQVVMQLRCVSGAAP